MKEILSFRGIGVRRIASKGLDIDQFLKECLSDDKCHYILLKFLRGFLRGIGS